MTQEKSPIVDRAILTSLAQVAMNLPNLRIGEWKQTTLSQQGQRTVFRFAGIGYEGSTPHPWALILKEIKAPESPDAVDHAPDCGWYWLREPLLYAAGVPQSLNRGLRSSGLRSPRCLGVVEPAPHIRWIWLEDLQDCYAGKWPLQRFASAAYQLGTFNGSYLVDKPLPMAPWLTNDGLRQESASKIANLVRLRNPTIWARPLLQSAFPTSILADLDRLSADRERFLAGAAALPRTFCHLDAHSDNMAAIEGTSDMVQTVLFDWALAGYGALGEDIRHLVWVTLLEFKLDIADAERLETTVFDSYIQGLADAGWKADPDQVRYAYLMSSVLTFTFEMEAVDFVLSTDVVGLERHYGWSLARMVEQNAGITYLLLERADTLRTMLDT
jgi:hypothetical protein